MSEIAASVTSIASPPAGTAARDGALIEVSLRPWWQRMTPLHLAATVSIAAMAVALIIAAGLALGGAVAAVIVVALLALLVWPAQRWMDQSHAVLVRAHRDRPIAEIVDRALSQPILLSVDESMRQTTRLLAAEGRLGATIRVCRAAEPMPIAPFVQAFEPCPLDAGDPAFTERAGGIESADGPRAKGTRARSESDDWRQLHLGVRRRGGWSVLALDIALLGLVTYAAVRQQGLSWTAYVILAMQVLRWMPPHRWFGLLRGEWLAVPGGVVVRRPVRRSDGWQVHLFVRDGAVLSAVRSTGDHWTLTVADAAEHAQTTVMREEAEFLLRAWLSPLRPPPLERMSDLT